MPIYFWPSNLWNVNRWSKYSCSSSYSKCSHVEKGQCYVSFEGLVLSPFPFFGFCLEELLPLDPEDVLLEEGLL